MEDLLPLVPGTVSSLSIALQPPATAQRPPGDTRKGRQGQKPRLPAPPPEKGQGAFEASAAFQALQVGRLGPGGGGRAQWWGRGLGH